jgi:hypothetical protein
LEAGQRGTTNNNVCHKNYAINFALKAREINGKRKTENGKYEDLEFKIRDLIHSFICIFRFPFSAFHSFLLFRPKKLIIKFRFKSMALIADLRTFLIALWLGAAVFFTAAVAQSAFAVLPSRELAGAMVNRTLAILNYGGIVVGLILLASSIIKTEKVNRLKLWIEQGLLYF